MTTAPWPAAAVDAIAERLSADYDSQRAWVKGEEVYREAWRVDARVLLGLPAVVRALTEARADAAADALVNAAAAALPRGRCRPNSIADWLIDLAIEHRASIRQTDERNDR